MSNFEKGWRGALMGVAAYLITALILSIILSFPNLFGFISLFYIIAMLGFVVGIIFVCVGTSVAIAKSPHAAVRPLIITSVIVLVAVGGCFGMIGLY